MFLKAASHLRMCGILFFSCNLLLLILVLAYISHREAYMSGRRLRLVKIATILLVISFFTQVLTVIGMVILQKLTLKFGIFGLLVKIHAYNGYIFVALVAVHIYFNWWWVKANILNKRWK